MLSDHDKRRFDEQVAFGGMKVIVDPLLPNGVAYLVNHDKMRDEIMRGMSMPPELMLPKDSTFASSRLLLKYKFPAPKLSPGMLIMLADCGGPEPRPAKPYRKHSQAPSYLKPRNRRWRKALARYAATIFPSVNAATLAALRRRDKMRDPAIRSLYATLKTTQQAAETSSSPSRQRSQGSRSASR